MKILTGRIGRILAGAVSAVMVLTSLPLTEVAVYAAPSADEVEDVAVDAAQEAVADDAGETAVADEASEPAAADETDDVTLTFERCSEEKEHIMAVSVNGVEKAFEEGENTVRFSVSPNVPCTFRIRKDDSDPRNASDFVFADWGDRNYEDSCQFTFTPKHSVSISCKLHWFKIMQDDVTKAVFSSGTVLSGLDCVKDPIEDINFTLSGVSENYVYCEVTAETLPVSESHGTYTISANALKNFVFNSSSDTIIELRVNGTKYEASRIIPPSNTGEVKYTVVESSLVKFGDVSYAKRDTDYRFKVEPAPALTAAGRDISRVTYTIGDGEAETVTANGEGFYSIPAADIVAAAKAKQDIKIAAVAGQELGKAKITVTKTVSDDAVDIAGFSLVEKDSGNQTVGPLRTVESDDWNVSGNTATVELEIQAGHTATLTDLYESELPPNTAFFRVTKDGKEVNPKNPGSVAEYSLGTIEETASVTVEAAGVRRDEIEFVPGEAPQGVTAGSNIESSSGYILALDRDLDLGLSVDDSGDPINSYKLKNVKYAVTGGSKGDAKKYVDMYGNVGYSLPSKVLREAAFAKITSGDRITVTAEYENTGYKRQSLMMIATGDADFEVVQNGAVKDIGDPGNTYADGKANLDYGKAASITVEPETGFVLEKAYLISKADLDAASMNMVPAADYVETLLQKVTTASSNKIEPAKVFEPGNDGKIKVNLSKVDGSYTLFVTTTDKAELVIWDKDFNDIKPVKGNCSVYWWNEYTIGYRKGDGWLPISGNTVSANVGAAAVTGEVFGSTGGELDYLTFKGENDAVNGNEVKVKFTTVDGKKQELTFCVSKKLKSGDIQFKDGTLSSNMIDIIEAQPLGTTVKYDLVNPWGVPLTVGATAGGVECRLVDKKNKGVIVGHELYVTSHAVNGLANSYIDFFDATIPTSDPNYNTFQYVEVSFDTDQVTKADLSGLKASADTDSITVDFSKAKGFDKTTEGLYYKVTYSTSESTKVLSRGNTSYPYYAPATNAFATVPLTYNPEGVEPTSISYNVIVELVQRDMIAATPRTIATSAKSYTASVETIADGVYATKVRLVKSRTAPRVIYGGSGGGGMGKFLLATATYPNVSGKPVTVRRLKKLVLLDSNGVIIDDSEIKKYFIRREGNSIYLDTWANNLPAGKYTLKAYAVVPGGADATGTLKFTVVNSIYRLDLNMPAKELYKAPGKAASLKATVTYNDGDKHVAPKTKKVKWYLTDEYDKRITPPAGMTFKNGVVKIAKNAVLPENYKFKIVAEAADFDHGDDAVWASDEITVTNTPRVPAEIYIGDTQITDGAKIESADLDGEIQVYDQNEERIENIKATVTGVLKKEKNGNRCKAYDLGKASVKVTTADGSKKSKKIKFTVDTDEGINGEFGPLVFDSSSSKYDYTNTYDVTEILRLYVKGDDDGFVDHAVKLDGFKKVKVKYDEYDKGYYTFVATKRNAKITITEKANKNNPTVINVTNTAFPASSGAAAAKITASNKMYTAVGGGLTDRNGTIFGNLDFESNEVYRTASCNRVEYTVRYGRTPAKAGEKVRLYSKEPIIGGAIQLSGGTDNNDGTYTMTLGEGGTFVIDYINADGDFELDPGTYKLRVTAVDDKGDAIGKAGTIKVKVVNAPKATLKTLKAKPVMFSGTSVSSGAVADLSFAKQANILISANGVGSAEFGVTIVDDESKPVDLDLRGLNVKGKINGFADMFEIEGGKLKYTGKKSPYYNTKKGISGQIAVTYTAITGERRYMYIPITVKGNFK